MITLHRLKRFKLCWNRWFKFKCLYVGIYAFSLRDVSGLDMSIDIYLYLYLLIIYIYLYYISICI